MANEIKVASFTKYPGPRYRVHGDFSGEEFREEWLIPALKASIEQGSDVKVIMDGVAGYGSGFLEESFGGLVRYGFSKEDLRRHLSVVAETARFQHHAARAREYIEEEAIRTMGSAASVENPAFWA